jgi:hypothetical protein
VMTPSTRASGARADVDTTPECDVFANVLAVQAEFVRILELATIAIGSAEARHHHGALGDVVACLIRDPQFKFDRSIKLLGWVMLNMHDDGWSSHANTVVSNADLRRR